MRYHDIVDDVTDEIATGGRPGRTRRTPEGVKEPCAAEASIRRSPGGFAPGRQVGETTVIPAIRADFSEPGGRADAHPT